MKKRMNKIKGLILILLFCLLAGCNTVLGLKHYAPPDESNLRIEFDYPKKWEWVYRPETSSSYAFEPDIPHYSSNKKTDSSIAGVIYLMIDVGVNPESVEEQIKSWQDVTAAIGAEILEDKTIMIDGVPARWISRRIPKRHDINLQSEVYSIEVFVYENHNLYVLSLEIPFERREGEFVSNFNSMLSTIEFVP